MITPNSYRNALMYLNGSSNQSSAFINGAADLSGSNIGGRSVNAGYGNFDLTPQARALSTANILVARFGLSRVAFPMRADWSWRSVPT